MTWGYIIASFFSTALPAIIITFILCGVFVVALRPAKPKVEPAPEPTKPIDTTFIDMSIEKILERRGVTGKVAENLAYLRDRMAKRLGLETGAPQFGSFTHQFVDALFPVGKPPIIPPTPEPVKNALLIPKPLIQWHTIYNPMQSLYTDYFNNLGKYREKFSQKEENEFIEELSQNFATTRFPYYVSEHRRFESMWIVAPTGHGKSTFLSYLIERDLEKVRNNKATVVVMESKRDLFTSIRGLARFAPGGDLYGKLVCLDLEDVEYPIALNLFDVGHIDTADAREREITFNAINAMFEYTFRALLRTDMTPRMQTMFTALSQLLLKIPDATIDTMREICEPGGLVRYIEYVEQLEPDAKAFFKTKWNDTKDAFTNQTKQLIADRIFTIKLTIPALGRMLSAKKLKVDFYKEMAEAKVILISYPKGMFQEEGTELLGRFFLAQIITAAQRRQFLTPDKRLPAYVYLDEAQDVIRRDERIGSFLSQCRALNVGMTFAHQRLDEDQLSPPVFRALSGTAAFIFAAKLSDSNASALARNMNCKPEFIASSPPYVYAAFVRGETESAVSYAPDKYVDFMRQERATESEIAHHQQEMRELYAILPEDMPEEPPQEEPPEEQERPEPPVVKVELVRPKKKKKNNLAAEPY